MTDFFRQRIKLLFYAWLFLGFVVPLEAKHYFVDDNGSDANNGTNVSAPFLTISKAAGLMMPLAVSSTCYIFPGNYSEQVEIYSNKNNGFMVFTRLSNSLPVLDGAGASNDIFTITNASRVILSGLVIRACTNSGIMILGNSVSNSIMQNEIYNNSRAGIMISGSEADCNRIEGNHIWKSTSQDYCIYILEGDSTEIRTNRLAQSGIYSIYLQGSITNTRIVNNQICSNSYGIYINYEGIDRNSIISNRIWKIGLFGIYIQQGDTNRIYRNLFADNLYGVYVDNGADGTEEINNTFFRHTYAIYNPGNAAN
ncbi:MAG: right-handed parallel beta-helix repeat-containing protein, partial [bacterium]|nr:right-handed parallel beta-helix repeat-containing protein [bacterium]